MKGRLKRRLVSVVGSVAISLSSAAADAPRYKVAFLGAGGTHEVSYVTEYDRLTNACRFSLTRVNWTENRITTEIITHGQRAVIGSTLQHPDGSQEHQGINWVRGLNDSGVALGDHMRSDGPSSTVYWSGGMVREFPPPSRSSYFHASHLNNLGVFVGEAIRNDYSGYIPALFMGGRYVKLVSSGFYAVEFMNERGSLLGYLEPNGGRAFDLGIKRLGGRIERLRQLPYSGMDFVRDMNLREDVLATRYRIVGPGQLGAAQAVLWKSPDSPQLIADGLGFETSGAVALNDAGAALGYGRVGGQTIPFIWTAARGAQLLSEVTRLDNGEIPNIEIVSDINNRGEILASISGSSPNSGIAILYPVEASPPCALR